MLQMIGYQKYTYVFIFIAWLGCLGGEGQAQIVQPVTSDAVAGEEPAGADNPLLNDHGVEPEAYTAPPVQPVEYREIRKDQWDDASGGLDYSKDVPEVMKEEKTPDRRLDPDWNSATKGFGQIMQVLAIILAV